ncbi:MAG: DUF438 domain-containing protein [Anaerolineae bacterium]|nr:DUF438 domain-containing protein [Anaerolineae bacterium]
MSEVINNQTKRREALKRVIRQLHEGKSVDEVKAEFASLLEGVGAVEIAALEQGLIAEGMPEMEIKRLCDVHVAAFKDALDTQERPESLPGHPVYTFRAENAAAAQVLEALEAAIQAGQWEQARAELERLREYDRHYLRKEYLLFPFLEKHAFSGPSAVMWAIHDDVRAGWKNLAELLTSAPDAAQVAEVFGPLATAIREMFYKEENILFPAALQMLSSDEWASIHVQEPEFGVCYVEASEPQAAAPQPAAPPAVTAGLIPLQTGALTPQQIALMLTHLPVDVTFVDENDAVQFFSATKERIFPRSPAIIGRSVQKCHPPASVHRVQRILDDFREGRRDEAEFWIQMGGKFIHIRYFAVRDEQGAYKGTVEVSQDVTAIRALQGERRLLDD